MCAKDDASIVFLVKRAFEGMKRATGSVKKDNEDATLLNNNWLDQTLTQENGDGMLRNRNTQAK